MNSVLPFNLLQYLHEENSDRLIFFRDDLNLYSYNDLINMSLSYYAIAKECPDDFLAILEDCPFHFFSKLLGNLLAAKKILILSNKLTSAAIEQIKNEIPFKGIINRTNLSNPIFPISSIPQINSYDDALIFLLTSGSSGRPKAVGLSINNILFFCKFF